MAKKEMEVVKGLDLPRYMGRWYEIASFPSRFQPKNGVNTRATYKLNEDGTIHVLNETWSDGKRGYIEGTAYRADPKSDEAKLKVKFYVPPFLPLIPVVGDYWVLFIDGDYQCALIGQPTRNYLWHRLFQNAIYNQLSHEKVLKDVIKRYVYKMKILCRQNHMDENTYNALVQRATDEGYDVSLLHRTTHTNPPPEGEEGPKDNKGIWWIKSMLGM
ncbi:hypothetical protein Sjap_019040 [Stephania japonica]|uniref:Lipocalin/cytosolic fatty-acid binding domain-containing protein n=1 Tax=Stephania japonica TaxID=461633 RepID=A0AAP0EZ95_9MAGN